MEEKFLTNLESEYATDGKAKDFSRLYWLIGHLEGLAYYLSSYDEVRGIIFNDLNQIRLIIDKYV